MVITDKTKVYLKYSFINAFYNYDDKVISQIYPLKIEPITNKKQETHLNFLLNLIVGDEQLMEHIFELPGVNLLKRALLPFWLDKVNGIKEKEEKYLKYRNSYSPGDVYTVFHPFQAMNMIFVPTYYSREIREQMLNSLNDAFPALNIDKRVIDERDVYFHEVRKWINENNVTKDFVPSFFSTMSTLRGEFEQLQKYIAPQMEYDNLLERYRRKFKNYIKGMLLMFGECFVDNFGGTRICQKSMKSCTYLGEAIYDGVTYKLPQGVTSNVRLYDNLANECAGIARKETEEYYSKIPILRAEEIRACHFMKQYDFIGYSDSLIYGEQQNRDYIEEEYLDSFKKREYEGMDFNDEVIKSLSNKLPAEVISYKSSVDAYHKLLASYVKDIYTSTQQQEIINSIFSLKIKQEL